MAIVGEQLTAPETGWKRYDDKDPYINYVGTWSSDASNGTYNGNGSYSNTLTSTIKFKFKGTKIRLIGYRNSNKTQTGYITIDGVRETFSEYGAVMAQLLMYEKVGLQDGEHIVEIGFADAQLYLDALDIDATGSLIPIIGSRLPTPEEGWKRYINRTPAIQYDSSWSNNANADMISSVAGAKAQFDFTGTKLRVLSYSYSNRSDMTISIDGSEPVVFKGNQGHLNSQTLTYEVTGLTEGRHKVVITNLATTGATVATIHAIDIDVNARLFHPLEVLELVELDVGKVIRGYYRGGQNTPGFISQFGGNEVHIDGEQEFILDHTANNVKGCFYLVATDRVNGKLVTIPDRILNRVRWDWANKVGYASRTGDTFNQEIVVNAISTNIPGWETSSYKLINMIDGSFFTFAGAPDNTLTKWEVYFTVNDPRPINSFKLMSYGQSGYESVGDFKLYGSNTSHTEDRVLLGTYKHEHVQDFREYIVNENFNSYKYITLEVTSFSWSNGYNNLGIHSIVFFTHSQEYEFTMRLMTGGTTTAVEEISRSEYNKYLVNEPLPINMNYKVSSWSWVSDIHPTSTNSRIVRGGSVNTGAVLSNSGVSSANGFRPIILIKQNFIFPTVSVDRDFYLVARNTGTKMNISVTPHNLYPDLEWGILVRTGDTRIYWSGYRTGTQLLSVTIPPRLFTDTSIKPFFIELMYDKKVVARKMVNARIVNDKPAIRLVRDGYKIELDIVDTDGDPMYYEFKLNGTDLVPGSQAIGELRMDYYLTSNMINIGGSNTVTVKVIDLYGDETTASLTFDGEYQGLIFSTEDGTILSTDGGSILKRMVLDAIYAGESSPTYPIVVTNKYPFNIRDLTLTIQYYEAVPDSDMFIGKDMVLVEEKVIKYDDMLSPRQGKTFHIKLDTLTTAVGRGKFRVIANARKV